MLGFAMVAGPLVTRVVASPRVTFPGQQAEARSPEGRFSISCVAADETPSGLHELWLTDRRDRSKRLLVRFGRSVEVVWAPGGRRVAMTDRIGSDTTRARIHSVDSGTSVSVLETLERQEGRAGLAFTRDAHHLYVEAHRWLDDSTLQVRIWGYGGRKPFDRRMRLTVSRVYPFRDR